MHTEARPRPPLPRLLRPGARSALLVGLAAVVVVTAISGHTFLASFSTPEGQVRAGRAAAFPPDTVSYVPEGHFYLVHLESGRFIALFERSPWLQRVHGPAPDACRIRWYALPAAVAPPTPLDGNTMAAAIAAGTPAGTTPAAAGHGFFRENCSGWMFDARGGWTFGGSGPLDRYRVRVVDGEVIVDTTHLIHATLRG